MHMNQLLIGTGVGMLAAFMLDPDRGRRRRALVGDQLRRARHKAGDAMGATARDIGNRSAGVVAAARGRFAKEDVDDTTLVNRVRARLGRVCSHPGAIDAEAHNGTVTLRGPVLASERDKVLAAIASVRGVASVENALETHETAENVPALQGTGSVAGPSLDLLQRRWAPATQAMVAAAGLAATGVCLAAYARR